MESLGAVQRRPVDGDPAGPQTPECGQGLGISVSIACEGGDQGVSGENATGHAGQNRSGSQLQQGIGSVGQCLQDCIEVDGSAEVADPVLRIEGRDQLAVGISDDRDRGRRVSNGGGDLSEGCDNRLHEPRVEGVGNLERSGADPPGCRRSEEGGDTLAGAGDDGLNRAVDRGDVELVEEVAEVFHRCQSGGHSAASWER